MSQLNQTDIIGTLKMSIKSVQNLCPLDTVNNVSPYIKVTVNSLISARTIALPDILDPTWNECLYIPVTHTDKVVTVEITSAESTTNDALLGHFNLNIADIVKINENGDYMKTLDSPLRSSELNMKGLMSQGTLYYTMAFFPALDANSFDFFDAETISGVAGEINNLKSNASKTNHDSVNQDISSSKSFSYEKSCLEQLVRHKSGVLSISFIDSQMFESNSFIRYFVDNNEFPNYTSPLIGTISQEVGQTSSAVIRELNHSQITFELVSKAEKPCFENIIASYKISTLDLLQNSYSKTNRLKINQNDRPVAIITLNSDYTPLDLPVDTTESVLNSGLLGISIVKADGISIKKSSHISTFVQMMVNRETLLTTQAVKKSINPVWNETLNVVLLARSQDTLMLKLYEKSTEDITYSAEHQSLGIAVVDLLQLQSHTLTTLTLPLKGNPSNGTITVSLLFEPAYVQRRINHAGIASLSNDNLPLAGNLVGNAGQIVEINASDLTKNKLKLSQSHSLSEHGGQLLSGTGKVAGAVAIGTSKAVYSVVGCTGRVIGGVIGGTGRMVGSICVGTGKLVFGTGNIVASLSGKVETGFKDTFKKRSHKW